MVTKDGDVLPPDIPDTLGWCPTGIEDHPMYFVDGQQTRPLADGEPRKLTPTERIMIVVTEAGFYPRSRREVNLALGAIENRDLPGGYGRYLNEVLRHQQKSVSEEPTKALISIVEEITGFAAQVPGNVTALMGIAEAIKDMHDFAAISGSQGLSDWQHQGLTRRGLQLLTQRTCFATALAENVAPNLDSPITDDMTQDVISKLRVGDARRHIKILTDEQRTRRAFWIDQLTAAQKHMAVKAMAFHALKKLGQEQPAA